MLLKTTKPAEMAGYCGENRISPSFSFCSFNLLRINTLKELSYDVLFIYSNVFLFNFVCKSKQ